MERAAYDRGVFFGTSPVIYKGSPNKLIDS